MSDWLKAHSSRQPRVLIVDDMADNRELLRRILRPEGFEFLDAGTPDEAVRRFDPAEIDLVILDLRLPNREGIEVCRRIKEAQADRFVPVIMVTATGDTDDKVAGFDAGADDFISRPMPVVELRARVRAMLRLKYAQDQLRTAAVTDGLTGLFNHRQILLRLAEEIERARRYQRPLVAIMADLDHFKAVNDSRGHRFGDFVLEETAKRLLAGLRAVDVVGRYGGEEFLIILPETRIEPAAITGERLRRTIADFPFRSPDHEARVTLSLGACAWDAAGPEPADGLVTRADAALYRAKEAGRNRVIVEGAPERAAR